MLRSLQRSGRRGKGGLLNKSIIHRSRENLYATLSESISPTKYNNFHTLSSSHQSLLYRAAPQRSRLVEFKSLYLPENGSREKQMSELISYRLHKRTWISDLTPSQLVRIRNFNLVRVAEKGLA